MLKFIATLYFSTLLLSEIYALDCKNFEGQYGKCLCTGNASVLTKQDVLNSCKLSTYLHWDCDHCRFDSIDYDAFNRVYDLYGLSLTNSSLIKLTNWTLNLGDVKTLDLSSNNLTTLTKNTFRKGNKLISINFSYNRLQSIDTQFLINSTQLETFNLSSNDLNVLSNNICYNQVPLKELDLSSNRIETIQYRAFVSCSKLEKLNLSKNRLNKITNDSLFGGDSLLEIDLSKNRIVAIESNALSNKKLILLNISNNQIEELETNVFKVLTNIDTIDFSYNKLKKISKELFENNSKLIRLFLNNNALETIEVGAFDSLKQLVTLNLQNNRLKNFDLYTFIHLDNLQRLLLNGNNFDNIDLVTLLKHNLRLKYLTIHGNKWSCSMLTYVIMDLKKVGVEIERKVTDDNRLGISCTDDGKQSCARNLDDATELLINERTTTNNLLIATLFFVVVIFLSFVYTHCKIPLDRCKRRGYNDMELINES